MLLLDRYNAPDRPGPAAPAEGWLRPPGTGKRHYFRRHSGTLYESLCGGYATGYSGAKDFKAGPDQSDYNCKCCQRRRLKLLKTSP